MIRLQPIEVSADVSCPIGRSGEQFTTAMGGSALPKRVGSASHGASLKHCTRSQRIAFKLVGILLTTTALAKLWMLLTNPLADVPVGSPKEFIWLSVAFEFCLV